MIGKKRNDSDGFTITELVIAMTVSAIVLASGYELFKSLRGIIDRQNIVMEDICMAKQIIEQIREDLLNSLPRESKEGNVFVGGNQGDILLQFYANCQMNHINNDISGISQIHKVLYRYVSKNGKKCLFRKTIPFFVSDNIESVFSSEQLLSDEIESIELAFYNGQQLETSFSSKKSLPVYVSIILTVKGQSWPLIVKLPCGSLISG